MKFEGIVVTGAVVTGVRGEGLHASMIVPILYSGKITKENLFRILNDGGYSINSRVKRIFDEIHLNIYESYISDGERILLAKKEIVVLGSYANKVMENANINMEKSDNVKYIDNKDFKILLEFETKSFKFREKF